MKVSIIGIVLVVAVFVGAYWLGNQPKSQSAEEIIKIGFFGPLSGPVAYTGEPVAAGFKIANKENSMIGNRKVEVIYEDDVCDSKKAVSAAQKLIEVDKVNILVSGVCSGSTLPVAPIAEEKGVILISPVAASPKITEAGDYVFRISASSNVSAGSSADLINGLGHKKIGVIYENNEYPVGYKNVFTEKFTSYGADHVVVAESFESGSTDVRTQLTKIKNERPDAVLFVALGAPMANLLLKQYEDLAINIPIFGNEVFSFKSIINQNQKVMEGMQILVYKYDLETPLMKKMLEAHRVEYGKDMTEEIYGALAYDTYNVLFNAIKNCDDDDPECLKKELYGTKNFEGASGLITIDENGDAYREFMLVKVSGGKIVFQ